MHFHAAYFIVNEDQCDDDHDNFIKEKYLLQTGSNSHICIDKSHEVFPGFILLLILFAHIHRFNEFVVNVT